jgi:hypothetical protein
MTSLVPNLAIASPDALLSGARGVAPCVSGTPPRQAMRT